MASRPCPVALTGCPGVDSPITNVSAEAPDPLEFASMVWTPNPRINPALGNGLDIPTECTPAQQNFFSSLPAIVIESPESQLYANLLALATELGCAFPPSTGQQQYMNDEQCATLACESGAQFSYCVPAGTLISGLLSPDMGAAWVVAANDWALAYAQQQASAIMDCSGGGQEQPETPPGDHPPTIPSGPGINPNASWMCFGETFFARTTISGGSTSAYSMSVSAGALAPGTTFVQDGPRTGYVSGTPTAPGAYSYTIRGVSTTLPNMTVQITNYLFVMGITNASSLPDATTGTAYSEALTSDGGTAPYTYALDTGSSLPTGLTLATNGTISGTPTADGDFTFDVVLTDANGGECVQTVRLLVEPGGIDWSTMVWLTSKSGSVSLVVPNVPGGTQDNCQTYIQAANTLSTALAVATGTINYTGPAVPIHFDGTVIKTPAGSSPPENQTGYLRITTKIGANPSITSYIIISNPTVPPGAIAMATGPFSVGFTIPDTGGLNCLITVQCVCSNVSAFGPAYELNITAVISND